MKQLIPPSENLHSSTFKQQKFKLLVDNINQQNKKCSLSETLLNLHSEISQQNQQTKTNFAMIKFSSMIKANEVECEILNAHQTLKADTKDKNNRDSLQLQAKIQPQPINVTLVAKINYRERTKSNCRAKSQYKPTRLRMNSSKKLFSYKNNPNIDKPQNESPIQTNRSKTSKHGQKKKVRLKDSSTTQFQEDQQYVKYKRCIPLQQYQIQEEELFMENTYRLRKDQMKIWNQNEAVRKEHELKNGNGKLGNTTQKDNKKVINQAYDYDGLLLPSQSNALKPKKHFVEPQIQITNQGNVESLANYHDRYPRYGRTSTKIKQKKKLNQIDDQLSSFAKTFQNIKWNPHIRTAPHSPRQTDAITKSRKKIQSKKDLQSKQKRIKTVLHTRSHSVMQNVLLKERIQKQRQNQDIMEEFQRIRVAQEGQSSKINFNFGFSKYLKVKKFQQKQHKSKSYNSHTAKLIKFSNPFELDDNLMFKQSLKKGSQKVRANKRLFKKVFNVSMKYISPQLRQDPPTVTCIKGRMQNAQLCQNKKSPTKKNTFLMQNSQARILRKSSIQKQQKQFQIKQTLCDNIQGMSHIKKSSIIDQIKTKNKQKQNHKQFKSQKTFEHIDSSKKLTKHGKHMLSRQSFNFNNKILRQN